MKTPQLLSQYLNSLQHLDNKYMAALVPEFLSRKIEFDAVEMRMQSVFMVEFDSDAFIPLIEDSVNSLKEMFLPSIPKLYNAMKASVNADNISTLQFRDSFERLLHETPRELNLKSHYPILYSQIHKCIENFLEFIEFIASSIQQDVKSLALNFGADPQAKIISVKPLDSDPHFGQKKVLNIKFSDGTNLVLKPRSLEIDLAFQNFLRWINSNSNSDDIQQMDLTIVSFQNRGWMPFVAQIPCTSEKDIIQYYRRIGDMMAILYLLVATDMHFENIIAHGAYPIICDLECLLQPFLKQENNSLFDGVEQIGMLPNALWMGREAGDISGISGQGNYKTNWTLPTLEINEQGDLVIEQRPLIVELGKNRPLFKGSSVCPSSYSAQIVDSFQNRYNFFLKMKEALVANTSPLNFFKRTPVRVILRNTSTYRKLYHESWIPSLLRSREKRETYFDWLDADAKNVDLPISVTISEKSDLWNNDIPHFTHIPQDECILDSKGNRIENLVEQGGWERLKNRFNGKMCLADLQRQKWFIKNTLLLLNPINPQLTDFEFVQTEKMEQEILIERLEWLKVAMGKGSTEFVPVQVGRNSNRNPVLQRNFHGVYNGSSGCLLVSSRQKSWEVQYLRCSLITRVNDALDLCCTFSCS